MTRSPAIGDFGNWRRELKVAPSFRALTFGISTEAEILEGLGPILIGNIGKGTPFFVAAIWRFVAAIRRVTEPSARCYQRCMLGRLFRQAGKPMPRVIWLFGPIGILWGPKATID